MNLIQRGTTASRANRGKSVMVSIAERDSSDSYLRHSPLLLVEEANEGRAASQDH